MKTNIILTILCSFLMIHSSSAQKDEGQYSMIITDPLKDNTTNVNILFDKGNYKISMKVTDKKSGTIDMVFYQLRESTDLIFVKDTQKIRIPLESIQKEKIFVREPSMNSRTEQSMTLSDGVYTAKYGFTKTAVLFEHLPLTFQLNELFSILQREEVVEVPGKIEILDKKQNIIRSFEISPVEFKTIDDSIFNIN